MTTSEPQALTQGQVFVTSEKLLRIHPESSFYVEKGLVIPDGTNWHKVLTTEDTFAIHSSELHLAKSVYTEDLSQVLVDRYNYPYISARKKDGGYILFINEQAAENNNYKFSFRLGKFCDADCSDFYGEEKTLSYHTKQKVDESKLEVFHSESDEYLLGLEVEKVDAILRDKGEAWKLLHETCWSKENDGSLNSGGYELISPILPLFNTRVISECCEKVKDFIDGGSDDSCGGHITLSSRKLTTEELFDSFKQFAPILYALYPKRLTNRYCKAKEWTKYRTYNEKYQAFYLKDAFSKLGGKVEIRFPNRVRNLTTLKWRIKLIQTLIKDAKSNLNQFAQKIGCPESNYYKLFAEQYEHKQIAFKLYLIDKYSKQYKTHRNGLSDSVKSRIINTMGFDVFDISNYNN